MFRVNLGCPHKCEGYTCVDLFPKEEGVIRSDALEYLQGLIRTSSRVDEIVTVNLLEHLPDVGAFLHLCRLALVPSGRLVVVTDNAEWLPFYLPFDIPHTGIGMHARESGALRFNTVHYCVFSKMHLRRHLLDAGFTDVKVRRLWRVIGARIEGTGFNRSVQSIAERC